MGFSSGLPIALGASTLQAWYTTAGVGIITIGALTLVGMPYVYKFLWAPLLDRFVPPFLGRRRGWILLMQIALTVILAVMAFVHPQAHPLGLACLALLLASCSATQDIAIDAYRTDSLLPEERGLGAAMVSAGYRVAMIISGALALIMAARIGWHMTYLIMAGLMALEIVITLRSPEPLQVVSPPQTMRAAIVAPFQQFLTRPDAWIILLFIIIYKLTDAFAVSLGTPFLIRDMGFSLSEIGSIYKMVGILASLLGAFIGGFLMMRLSLYRALFYFGIAQSTSNLMFMWLAIAGKNYAIFASTVFVENFCSGLGTVALVAFLMSLCDARYTAAQYALLSALSTIGRVFVGPIAAVIIKHVGWAEFYFFSFLIGIPSLLVLLYLRKQIHAMGVISYQQ